jgi:hypothetical protein
MSDSRNDEKGFLGRSNSFWIGVTGVCTVLLLIVAYATYRAATKPSPNPVTTPTTTPAGAATTPIAAPASSVPLNFSFTGASPYPCSDEGQIHSVIGGLGASYTFYNNSSSALQVIWLNYGGGRYLRATVAPGNYWSVDTYTGYLWMVAASDSTCQGIFFINGSGDLSITS